MGSYRERLLVPVSYWLLAVPVAVTLGAEAYFFVDGFIPPLVIGVLLVIAAAFLVHWSSATIEVAGEVLRAGSDTLALSDAGEVIALDERQATALRGPRADPAARILLRPYLKRAVCIRLADPDEGVPYWLVATRHPEKLAAAIESARPSIADTTGADTTGAHTTDAHTTDAGTTDAGTTGDYQHHGRQPGSQPFGDCESVG
jgi:hypothetical protein